MRKIIHVVSGFICFMSFIYGWGLAGASDCDTIAWDVLWPRVNITLIIMIISLVIWFSTDVVSNNKRRNKHYH